MSTKVREKNVALRKILGMISLIVIIANIFCRLAFRLYSDLVFWMIIIAVAIIAWPVMNWLKK
jgi:hypothetical protein